MCGNKIDGKYELTGEEIACEYSCKFQSVIGTGKLILTEDKNEKIIEVETLSCKGK